MCEYCGCQTFAAIAEQDGVLPAALSGLGAAERDAVDDAVRVRVGSGVPIRAG
jgi:hypothetical protein